ncbi:hypothetical protein JDV02_003215 [Purpureocillium takamizusanense]|uniref:Cytochrome P450 n=1 Tax=Purpureocillium takamizusanense TaxID=2060973 RepID=A0A9Q8QBZ6_9HYPO|nr:uncharacterized protein JDV02_003215 [Purpureocillium takamizusanense]UNI16815.1 hypothetical protein JDV02_003215 [Purpureocillium takamizusanense]
MPWLDSWLSKNPIVKVPFVSGGISWSYLAAVELYTNGKHYIDKYRDLKDTYPDLIDDEQVLRYLTLNLIAGGDTTSGTLRAILYHVAKAPSVYSKLISELDAAKLSLPAQWSDISKLPYLNAVVYESSRITPGIGLMFERHVPAGGCKLPDGRFIPAGTKVGINPCVVSRDTDVFGDDVEAFKPERWLQRPDEDDKGYAIRSQRMRETTDLTFGAGNRVCMGKSMAKMEIYKLVATLYSTFDIKLPDERHEWTYRNSWLMFHENIPMLISRRARL